MEMDLELVAKLENFEIMLALFEKSIGGEES
jgi:hypothetical protein